MVPVQLQAQHLPVLSANVASEGEDGRRSEARDRAVGKEETGSERIYKLRGEETTKRASPVAARVTQRATIERRVGGRGEENRSSEDKEESRTS